MRVPRRRQLVLCCSMDTEARSLRLHDWIGGLAAVAGALAIVALLAGRGAAAFVCAVVAVGSAAVARRSSRREPGPMPYALRWVLFLPRWPLTVARLRTVLAPRPGEHLLEIGPGPGVYALPIAAALAPGGRLEAFDVQADMLTALMRRAQRAGLDNIVATPGDAQRLPFTDGSIDGAYMVSVLGEIPQPSSALRELRRVLKPDGRLVIGESFAGDPDAVPLAELRQLAADAGLVLEQQLGSRVAYFARFRPR